MYCQVRLFRIVEIFFKKPRSACLQESEEQKTKTSPSKLSFVQQISLYAIFPMQKAEVSALILQVSNRHMSALIRESQVNINWDMLYLSIGLRAKQLLKLILPLWHSSFKVSSPHVISSAKVG